MTIDARKNNIVEKLTLVQEEWILRSIEHLLSAAGGTAEPSAPSEQIATASLAPYTGNYYKKFDLEEAIRERPPKKIDMEAWKKKADELVWEQSIEELLEDLK